MVVAIFYALRIASHALERKRTDFVHRKMRALLTCCVLAVDATFIRSLAGITKKYAVFRSRYHGRV